MMIYYGYYPMMGWGVGWLGFIIMIVFWAAIIVGVVFLVRWLISESRKGGSGGAGNALNILKERYARGEINKEEFEEKKKELS